MCPHFIIITYGVTIMTDFKISNTNGTIVGVVLDMSGSMSGVARQTRDGYNEYIDSLKADKELGEVFVTLTVFDSDWKGIPDINVVYNAMPLESVPKLAESVYMPRGGTPLCDATGATIRRTEEALKNCKGTPNVLLVIITDGMENASKEFTRELISKMIKEKVSQGWTTVYLGANQDSWKAGASLGIAAGNTINYDANDIRTGAFAKAASGTSNYRSIAASSNVSYTTTSFFADAGVTEDEDEKKDEETT